MAYSRSIVKTGRLSDVSPRGIHQQRCTILAVFGSLYFANNCTLWPSRSPSLVSGPLLVSHRTNFWLQKSQLWTLQAAEEGSYVTKKEGSFSPRPPDNIQRGGIKANRGRFAAKKITIESLAGYVWWLLSLSEPLKHLQEKVLQVLKRRKC